MSLEKDLQAVDALISNSVSSLPVPNVVAMVQAWQRVYSIAVDNAAALEQIKEEQKLKGEEGG